MLSHFSRFQLFVALWTVALQAPLFMGFFQARVQSGLPCPSPRDPPDTGMESTSLTSPALASGFFTSGATWEAPLTTGTPEKSLDLYFNSLVPTVPIYLYSHDTMLF